jgi:hypothetical protein
MFERLFGGSDPAKNDAARRRRKRDRKSILGFAAEDASRVCGTLGVADRRKLDEYLPRSARPSGGSHSPSRRLAEVLAEVPAEPERGASETRRGARAAHPH